MFKTILITNLYLSFNFINALLLPAFPNNIVCFPERDFCSIDGYIDYAGQELTLNVDTHIQLENLFPDIEKVIKIIQNTMFNHGAKNKKRYM